MAANDSVLQDPQEPGEYPDWIELYNIGTVAVDIGGWYLTDDLTEVTKWQIPSGYPGLTTIPGGGYLILYADNDPEQGVLHLDFGLSKNGEELGISADGISFIDSVIFPAQQDDVSMGLSGGEDVSPVSNQGSLCRTLVPQNAALGTNWLQTGFDDSSWSVGPTGVGYERGSGYETMIGSDLETDMYNQNGSAYIRIPFNISDASAVTGMRLEMQFDDGFIAWINGVQVASSNAPLTPVYDSLATGDFWDVLAVIPHAFDLGVYTSVLHDGANLLAIQGLNQTTGSSDFLAAPRLSLALGRVVPGSPMVTLSAPTPGAANPAYTEPPAERVVFSFKSMTFSDPFPLTLSATNSAEKIFYTLDGTQPDTNSLEYTGPIWVAGTTAIRAVAYETGRSLGPVSEGIYIRLGSDARDFRSELPVVVIDNYGGGNIPEIDPKQPACMAIYHPTHGWSSLANSPDEIYEVAIRRRGESSMRSSWWKPNLAIEGRDAVGNDRDIAPLGLPADDDWILFAPWAFDKALVRNSFIYELSRQMGWYASRTRFVEVILNWDGGTVQSNDYYGVYVLMERVKRNEERVDVEVMDPFITNGPGLDGGYVFKKDKDDPDKTAFSAAGKNDLYHVYPNDDSVTSVQRNYLIDFINTCDAAVMALDYEDLVDVDSCIDHQMLNMYAQNADGLHFSTFFHKDRGGKFVMGPIWDFDRSMGCDNDNRPVEPWHWSFVTDEYWLFLGTGPLWFRYWSQNDPDFWQRWLDRWQNLREAQLSHSNVYNIVVTLTNKMERPAQRDFLRWSAAPEKALRSGGGLSGELNGSWQGEVRHLLWWLSNRILWLDSNFVEKPVLSHSSGIVSNDFQLSVLPIGGASIYYTTDGSDPRAPGGAVSASAMLYTGPISITQAVMIRVRATDGTTWIETPHQWPWSGCRNAVFHMSEPEITISEIMYHCREPQDATLETNFSQGSFDFIEIKNIGSQIACLADLIFCSGIDFSFSEGALTYLQPGEYAVVVEDLKAFTNRYTNWQNINILGEYSGNLNNAGESIILGSTSLGVDLLDFDFEDDWYPHTDGDGYSLVMRSETLSNEVLDGRSGWRGSSYLDGSPGMADPLMVPAQGNIIISEVVSHQDTEPPGDWVELHNTTVEAIDISGWFLSDNDNNLTKYEFPPGSVIPAGGYLKVDEYDDFGTNAFANDSNGFAFSEHGEEICLSSGFGGSLSEPAYREYVEFDASRLDNSWGSYERSDGATEFVPLSAATPLGDNSYPRVGDVIISEVHYHPTNGSHEYVVLRNRSGGDIELFDAINPSNTWRLSGIDFSFPPGTTIRAGERIILCGDGINKTNFCNLYGVPVDYQVFSFEGSLENGGEWLKLREPGSPDETGVPYYLVDQVRYNDVTPWPVSCDGGGQALSRLHQAGYGNEVTNWTSVNAYLFPVQIFPPYIILNKLTGGTDEPVSQFGPWEMSPAEQSAELIGSDFDKAEFEGSDLPADHGQTADSGPNLGSDLTSSPLGMQDEAAFYQVPSFSYSFTRYQELLPSSRVKTFSRGGRIMGSDLELYYIGGAGGQCSYRDGIYRMNGLSRIWGAEDRFKFACLQSLEEFEITVRIQDADNANSHAGLMLRSGLASGAPYVLIGLEDGKIIIQRRYRAGISCIARVTKYDAKEWQFLRLARQRDTVVLFISRDGEKWLDIFNDQLDLADTYAGFFAGKGYLVSELSVR